MIDALRDVFASLHDPRSASAVVAAALAVAICAHTMSSAPVRAATWLGPRGLRRRHAVAKSATFATIEPVLRWLGTRLSGTLPAGLVVTLDKRMARAGDLGGITPEEYVASLLVSSAVGAGLAALYVSYRDLDPLFILGGAVFAPWLFHAQIDDVIARRASEITQGLPYVVDLLALGMTAGLDFPSAVRQIVVRSSTKDDALTQELERVLQELALAHTRSHVLQELAERTAVPAAAEVAMAVIQSEERGSPLVETLNIQAQVLRQKRSTNAEEAAAKAAQAMTLPLLLLAASTLIMLSAPVLMKISESLKGLA